MKWFLLVSLMSMVSCATTFEKPRLGMSEKEWRLRRPFAQPAAMSEGQTVYRFGEYYYYFRDGRLHHVDGGANVIQIISAPQ